MISLLLRQDVLINKTLALATTDTLRFVTYGCPSHLITNYLISTSKVLQYTETLQFT